MKAKLFLQLMAFSVLMVITLATGCNRNPTLPAGIITPTFTPTVTFTVTPPSFPPANSVFTSNKFLFQQIGTGPYSVESNYWNSGNCPVSQGMEINDVTGAFSVTLGPSCTNANTVSTYPNIWYGNELGHPSSNAVPSNCVLPEPVSLLNTVTSSWTFTEGGGSSDSYDIAYDLWFCKDNTCASSGSYPGGAELMIWLDWQNAESTGQNPLTTVTLSGSRWSLYPGTGGSGASAWTYLAYQANTQTQSVTNLNLLAFIQDAVSRGYIQPSWYFYAIPAGIEGREGGFPFTSDSFSVSIQ